MRTPAEGAPASAVEMLRFWRHRRRMSQLDLAQTAAVSTKHLSFVETGRSRPSRQLLVHLADALAMPLRERNRLLLVAGFAPPPRRRVRPAAPRAPFPLPPHAPAAGGLARSAARARAEPGAGGQRALG